MAQKFSFKKLKKAIFPVELPDGTTVTLREPTKAELEAINDAGQQEDMVSLLALALSANLEGKTFSAEDFDEFSVTELLQFSQAYTDFINELYPKN
ncbi:hypothetical protein EVA_10183 [gut metagenome]|uniref:Phage tail assembly protein n=1 Tax=gut metagenome TaxID=749906 RepID=J9GP38_9ZZZZ